MNDKNHSHPRSDDADAFLPDPFGGKTVRDRADRAGNDSLADVLGKSFVNAVTSGEEVAEDLRDEVTPEELGGPFVITRGRDEFATDDDIPIPEANREAFPTSSSAKR